MTTIRNKLALYFSGFILLMLTLGIAFNLLFLEKYYVHKNFETFRETSLKIEHNYLANSDTITTYLALVNRLDGISAIITDDKLKPLYSSSKVKASTKHTKLNKDFVKLIENNNEILKNDAVYEVTDKKLSTNPMIVFIEKFEQGEYLILRKEMKSIRESVAIANQFFIYSGIVIFIIGGIFIRVFSRRVTRPILEMSKTVDDISSLKFGRKVQYNKDDELGNLGKKINLISERLSANLNELQQDVARRKMLVRNLTHELKSPIGIVKGYAEGLKFGVADNPNKSDKYLSVIIDECNRMDDMIRDLLQLSMMDAGVAKVRRTSFQLSDIVNRSRERFATMISDKQINVDFICQNESEMVGDPELIQRALDNFMINAIHHVDEKKQIQIRIEKNESTLRLSVYNSGQVIPEYEQSQLWDVFYKVDKARSREYGGHGLGLSIVKLIADIHGAEVGVDNEMEGVTFYIAFPI